MYERANAATLQPRDPPIHQSVTAAEDWLPKEDQAKSRREAGEQGSTASPEISTEAQQWLPDSERSAPPQDLAEARGERDARNGSGPREPAKVDQGGYDEASHLSRVEELAEQQRIEISVLVRRVEELESELSATRKEAPNAKREARRDPGEEAGGRPLSEGPRI